MKAIKQIALILWLSTLHFKQQKNDKVPAVNLLHSFTIELYLYCFYNYNATIQTAVAVAVEAPV